MRCIEYLSIFLRIHGLLPPETITRAGVLDTLRIISLTTAPIISTTMSTAYMYVNAKSASVVDMTEVMCSNLVCYNIIINNYILAYKKFKIRAIVTKMREMVEKRRAAGHFQDELFARVDRRCDNLVKMFAFTYAFVISGVFLVPIIRPIQYWATGRYPFQTSFISYKAYLPNDFIETPLGWLMVCTTHEIGNLCGIITVTSSVALYSCLMLYLAAFLDDVSSSFHHLDALNAKRLEPGKKHGTVMQKYFVDTLNLHNWILEFRSEVVDLVSPFVFCWIFDVVGIISTNLLQIQVAPSLFSAGVFRAVGLIVGPLIYLYLFCLMGQLVTNRSQAVAGAAYTSQWYDYSLDLRKYIWMTIAYSQIDFNMMALGFVNCNMESYKKLVNAAVSYFMVFRSAA